PNIKAFFICNPGNPTSMAVDADTRKKLVDLVKNKRPDLIVLTDDVYGTFVPGFRSLMADLPYNTIGVYSFSKYFGCTGWRLGVIALHDKHMLDDMIAKLPKAEVEALDKRYGSLTLTPREMKMIDRIVADSRDVALNHTAGLSLPQQVMMTMFSLSELMDANKVYQKACMEICQTRVRELLQGLPLNVQPNPNFAAYYGTIDFEFWLRKYLDDSMVTWLKKNVHPVDLVYKLSENPSVVLLNGGGFDAPNWSVRVSFANLPDEAYEDIGRAVRAVGRGYVDAYAAHAGMVPPGKIGEEPGSVLADQPASNRSRAAQSRVRSSARDSRANSSSISSAVMTSGGHIVTVSPTTARTINPSSSARRTQRWATCRLGSNACLVFLSATSSTPPIRPSPRASPTSGCSLSALR